MISLKTTRSRNANLGKGALKQIGKYFESGQKFKQACELATKCVSTCKIIIPTECNSR